MAEIYANRHGLEDLNRVHNLSQLTGPAQPFGETTSETTGT
jgi:hypothetical protein